VARPTTFLKRTLAISGKEWMHLGRDPATLLFAILMPLIMIVLFGYAVSFDADHLRTVVVDEDRTAESRELAQHLFSGTTFVSVGARATPGEGERALREGDAALVLVLPRGFGEDLRRGREGRVQLLVDAADNTTATSVLSYAGRFAANRNDELARRAGLDPRGLVEARARALFNPSMRSAVFLTPGLIALIMAMMGVLLTAVTVAREWERGSMEQLFATPVTRGEIVAGKLLPYFAIAMLQFLLVLACGAAIFEMPLRGSMPLLFGMATLFLLAMLCQGLFVSSVAKNQMVATQMAALSSMLPSMLLSGFIAPIDNMPRPLQILSNIVPARHFIHALRAILLRGADPSIVAYDAAFLAVFIVLMLVLAMRAFPRSLA
jgi:ABC-2 type transport system permease protein